MKTVAFFASTLLVAVGLTGCGGGGTSTSQPSISVTLTVSTPQVYQGDSVNVTWSATNATTCTATGGWSGSLSTSGTRTESVAVLGDLTYKITCTNGSQSTMAQSTISSTEKPFFVEVRGAFADPSPLPDLAAKYASLCGSRTNVSGVAAANLSGHRDGRKDLLFALWCDSPYETVDAPTVNGLIALIQQPDGTFVDGTKKLFGSDLVDMAGGVAGMPAVYDFNGDGLDDIVYPVSGEDGRSLPQGLNCDVYIQTYNRQNIFLTSKPDGTYSVLKFGWPGYNFSASLVDNRYGGKDALTKSIGYCGQDQAFRFVENNWIAVSDYDGAPDFSGRFFISPGGKTGVDRAISQTDSFTVGYFRRDAEFKWTLSGTWGFEKKADAPYRSWNGDIGRLAIFSFEGKDYGFPMFGVHCHFRPSPGGDPITIFAVPAQEVVGGYHGQFLTESFADFAWHLILVALSDARGTLEVIPLSFSRQITDAPMYDFKCSDYNGDGMDDIYIRTSRYDGDTVRNQNAKPIVYLNDGKGKFALVRQSTFPDLSPHYPHESPLYEDLDGDGIPDLLYYPTDSVYDATKVQYKLYKGLRRLNLSDTE